MFSEKVTITGYFFRYEIAHCRNQADTHVHNVLVVICVHYNVTIEVIRGTLFRLPEE